MQENLTLDRLKLDHCLKEPDPSLTTVIKTVIKTYSQHHLKQTDMIL